MNRIHLLALLSVLLIGCGALGGQCSAAISGKPTQWDLPDNVRCYTYTQGSIACVQLR